MGLYAADTTGDGNCLFRALSDQLYGTPSHHAQLREEVCVAKKLTKTCTQLERYPDKYAGFVETGPFDAYVATMRELGTYGGHLELSAFAHLKEKNIRIVQPGLVYVVACGDETAAAQRARRKREWARKVALEEHAEEHSAAHAQVGPRTRRRKRLALSNGSYVEPLESVGPLHIAYHNWEHYSSLRSIHGPHTGLPCIPDPSTSAFEVNNKDEQLVMLSAPGHPRSTVRRLLQELGDWELVVEELIQCDAREHSGSTSPAHSASPASSDGTGTQLAHSAQLLELCPECPHQKRNKTALQPVRVTRAQRRKNARSPTPEKAPPVRELAI